MTNKQLLLLQRIIGFDSWHVSTLQERPYAMFIVECINYYISQYNCKGYIIEVGGGLGDIIASCNYPGKKKILYDIDTRVLLAGVIVHPYVNRVKGDFCGASNYSIDFLIAVNYLSGISGDKVKQFFAKAVTQNDIKWIVVDEVESPPYLYMHDYGSILDDLGYMLELKSKGYRAESGSRRHVCFYRKLMSRNDHKGADA